MSDVQQWQAEQRKGMEEVGEGAVLRSRDATLIARKMCREVFGVKDREGKVRMGLYRVGWLWWRWDGFRWVSGGDDEGVAGQVWKWLGDAKFVVTMGEVEKSMRFGPKGMEVKDVVEALKAYCAVPEESKMPLWLGEEKLDVGRTIAFEDKLVTVTEEGGLEVRDRTMDWVDGVVLPVKWDPDAVCPEWDRVMKEWAGGEEGWEELWDRWGGYCLMPTRKYARALVEIGVGRCGKGVRRRVLKALLGKRAVFEVSLEDLTMPHGLEGAPGARVIAVPEISRLGKGKADKAGEVIRKVLGLDDLQINPKGVRARQVMVEAAIMMSGHEIPTLSNKARGLSGKLLPLANNRSWLGKEDFGLEDRLVGRELQGIAARWVRGAQRLEQERDPSRKWVLPGRSKELVRHFELENNPAQGFLEECFVSKEDGWVPVEWVWTLWMDWRRRNKIRGVEAPRRQQFARWLESEGAWQLMVGVQPGAGSKEEVMWGLSVRREAMRLVYKSQKEWSGEEEEEEELEVERD
jgi:hypothetical protein